MNYDVFIDESGLFTETSTDPGDRIVEHKRRRKFPSQLAGVIAPEGQLTADAAWELFEPACAEANVTVGEEFHSTKVKKRGHGIFDKLVVATCESLERAKIQPFLIVNRERVRFGDRKANYVNILGELLVRVCKQMDREGGQSLTLNVFQAGVKNSEFEEGSLPFWEHDDFRPTLQTVFQRAGIAAGWAKESAKWQLGTFKFRSGKKDERLWLCDLISNASHDNFKTVSGGAANALKRVLAEYDFSLSFDTTLEQVRQLTDRQAYAVAMVQLVEQVLSPWSSKESRAAYASEFDRVAEQLIDLPPLARGPQMQTILGWLHQTADDRQRLNDATAACKWIEDRLVEKHEAAMTQKDATLASWLRLGISTAWLTACNHGGNLVEGKQSFDAIEAEIPKIAGRWEFASDLMRAIVVQAVHLNDCFEHKLVCEKMDLVADYYRNLGGLFSDAYGDVFPDSIRSKVCGEALGTKVQSETFLLLAGERTVDAVRETSEQAIEQFSDEDDRRRQFQYRSEVEAIAEQWQTAREYVAKGIGSSAVNHTGLAEYIANLPEDEQGFPLLHWTRIGGMAAVAGDADEFQDFAAAWRTSRFDQSNWLDGEIAFYPTHGILRRLACIYAALGDDAKVIETLRSLRSVVKANPTTLFELIEVAAVLQTAGLAGRRDPSLMTRILSGTKNDPAISELIKKLVKDAAASQPKIAALASQWVELLAGTPSPAQLVDAAKVVAY